MVARSHKYWTTSSETQSCHRQVDNAGWMSPWLAIIWWRLSPSSISPGIAQTIVEGLSDNWCWREDWQSATVVNSTLVVNPTIQLPGFDLHRRQWSLLNRFHRFRTGHFNVCHKKWGFTDNELCDCGEIQTMSHIVNSCPLTKFYGGLLRLHEADEAAVDWLTTYGS